MDLTKIPRLPNNADRRGAIAWMTRHSVAPNLLMMFFIIGGLIAVLRVKQEVFPEFELDLVTVTVPYPGASPEEVEQGIILAIEEGIRGLDGIKEVRAMAREGSGIVTAELEPRVNRQRVYQEVQQEVNRITTFPEAIEQPEVVLVTNKRDVMDVILYGEADEWVLRVLAEQVRDRILQDGKVTQIELEPDRIFEVSIEVPQENLRAYNLTLSEVAARIRTASVEIPGGSIRTDAGEILLRMKERRDWAREFSEIPVISSEDGTQLLVRDIAVVRDEFAESYEFLTYNGKPAVNLAIFRVGDQTPLGVSKAVKNKLEEIRPDLPPGVHIDIRSDRSDIYRQRLQLLTKNGLLGLVLVLVILTIFLEYKLAFWVTMGIVVSFMGAMCFLPVVDVTINMVSMFAFIVALGIVVDDAIVVGENVFEYRNEGKDRLASAIRGAQDVVVPVTFSILTNIAAFTPLLFIPGIMGKVWRVVPLVVCSVFIVSLFESLFVLPAHLAHMKKDNATSLGRAIHRVQDRLSAFIARSIENIFGPLLDLVLRARYLTVSIGMATLFVVVGYIASGRLGFEMAPKVESDQSVVTAVLPYGSPLAVLEEVNDRLVRSVQEVAAENGGLQLMRGVRASISENQVFVVAYLTDPDVRPINTFVFTEKWRERVGFIPGLESIRFQSDRGGPGSGPSLTVELAHADIPTLDHASTELAEALAQFANVSDIDDGYTPGKQQFDFQMRPEGRSLGLTAAEVARQLRSSFYGAEALRQQRGRNEVKVMVRLPNMTALRLFHSFRLTSAAGV
ncbi:MAG: efflux RND transporter permease subunit [Phycisphaerales bacterium]|nr:efflux RND transporter permease subunit [Phycisphaerales bacterium]